LLREWLKVDLFPIPTHSGPSWCSSPTSSTTRTTGSTGFNYFCLTIWNFNILDNLSICKASFKTHFFVIQPKVKTYDWIFIKPSHHTLCTLCFVSCNSVKIVVEFITLMSHLTELYDIQAISPNITIRTSQTTSFGQLCLMLLRWKPLNVIPVPLMLSHAYCNYISNLPFTINS